MTSGALTEETRPADVTGVDVANGGSGNVGFRVTWAGAQPLPKDGAIYIVIDTDRDSHTGDEDGAEVILEFDGDPSLPNLGTWYAGRWDGTKIDWDWNAPTGRATFQPGEIDVGLNTSDLNGTKEFDFWVFSDQYSGDNVVAEDSAPDGSAVYTYQMTTPPPPPPPPPAHLNAGHPFGSPVAPVAGKRFVVWVHVVRSDSQPVARATVTCTARARTKVVKATGILSGGFAKCQMTVPKGTKGKMLRGSVSVTMTDAHASKAFAFKIH